MQQVSGLQLPASSRMSREQLFSLVDTIRLTESTYKSAGSVHACALFAIDRVQPELLLFIEDVGRHNAVDTIAGWSWLRDADPPRPMALYTTGRLTSEMVIKAAQMGVPFVISRSGITQMGHQVAELVGLCAIGRALNRRYLCFSHPQRLLQD
jgi:FdhD protein